MCFVYDSGSLVTLQLLRLPLVEKYPSGTVGFDPIRQQSERPTNQLHPAPMAFRCVLQAVNRLVNHERARPKPVSAQTFTDT